MRLSLILRWTSFLCLSAASTIFWSSSEKNSMGSLPPRERKKLTCVLSACVRRSALGFLDSMMTGRLEDALPMAFRRSKTSTETSWSITTRSMYGFLSSWAIPLRTVAAAETLIISLMCGMN